MLKFVNKKVMLSTLFLLALGFSCPQSSFSQQISGDYINAGIQSQRIPEGTVIKVRMETPLNTTTSTIGDDFFVTLAQDIVIGNKLILPTGSVIRGTISEIKESTLLRKGAKVTLYIDHIVTPVGKQVPVTAKLASINNLNFDGQLTSGTNYFTYFNKNFKQGTNIVKKVTQAGVNSGSSFWGGYPVVVTVPVCAFGGAAGGAGVFVGKSFVDLMRKGDEVVVNSGQYFDIVLLEPLDIPLN